MQTIPLWPEGVPGRHADGGAERWEEGRVSNIHDPTLTYLAPSGPATGTAVIMAPGGGYARLAMANEAAGVATRLSPLGVATFVLKYRVGDYRFPASLQDVLRAVRIVRSRAAEFGGPARSHRRDGRIGGRPPGRSGRHALRCARGPHRSGRSTR